MQKNPAGHKIQATLPFVLKEPPSHKTSPAVGSEHSYPAVQAMHLSCTESVKVPARQAVHADTCVAVTSYGQDDELSCDVLAACYGPVYRCRHRHQHRHRHRHLLDIGIELDPL